jgi:phosphoribosylanthranilate isomerase
VLDPDLQQSDGPDVVLAGGLPPENIARAVSGTGIRNLDVNSGIESAAGIKDHEKMRAVMHFKHISSA